MPKHAKRMENCRTSYHVHLDRAGNPASARLLWHNCKVRDCKRCYDAQVSDTRDSLRTHLRQVKDAQGQLVFLTLTAQSAELRWPIDKPRAAYEFADRALEKFKLHPETKLRMVGAFASFEETVNARAQTWHPHWHLLAELQTPSGKRGAGHWRVGKYVKQGWSADTTCGRTYQSEHGPRTGWCHECRTLPVAARGCGAGWGVRDVWKQACMEAYQELTGHVLNDAPAIVHIKRIQGQEWAVQELSKYCTKDTAPMDGLVHWVQQMKGVHRFRWLGDWYGHSRRKKKEPGVPVKLSSVYGTIRNGSAPQPIRLPGQTAGRFFEHVKLLARKDAEWAEAVVRTLWRREVMRRARQDSAEFRAAWRALYETGNDRAPP